MAAKLAKRSAPAKPNPTGTPLAAALLAWYGRHARRLPWRTGPRERNLGVRPDPYRIWLSEVMLQQTTVKAVGPYFLRFVERWPSVADLAQAGEADVMAAWAGLGYYSRARNLITCAREVATMRGGVFPRTSAELQRLPGIGAYTSAAIAAIAFDEPALALDGNVERVAARLFGIDVPFPAAQAVVRTRLQPLVPEQQSGAFAEALMDLGATICTPRKPACSLCPWSADCIAHRQGREVELPVKAPKPPRPTHHGTAYVARRADGAILLRRRAPRGLLGGMSEVPGSEWLEAPNADPAPPLDAAWRKASVGVEHTFTHFSLRLSVQRAEMAADAAAPPGHWWSPAETLQNEALPSVMKKAIEAAYPGITRPSKPTR